MYRRLFILVITASIGCGGDDGATGACETSADCASGELCLDGRCQAQADAGPDGGPGDGGGDADADAGCPTPCGGECCVAGKACRSNLCFTEQTCTSHDDCLADSYCDDDGLCTPYGDGEFDDRCQREPEGPDHFLAAIQCAYTAAPAGDAAPDQIEAHGTPIVIDLNLDGDPLRRRPSVVWIGNNVGGGPCVGGRGVLRVVDGETCEQQFAMTDDAHRVSGGSPAAGDLDGDGRPEIVAMHMDGGLIAFTVNAAGVMEVLFRSTARVPAGGNNCSSPAIADVDDDGVPEILLGGLVYDASGALIADNLGDIRATTFASVFSVVTDVDLDGEAELVTHQGIYRFAPGTPAQWVLEDYYTGGAGSPGWVAIADFGDFAGAAGDAPGRPEVVIAGSGEIRVESIGGDVVAGPFDLPGSLRPGGPPTVADFDGDGEPEFGAADDSGYTVYELTGARWSQASQDASSGVTGSSVFDFEADGSAEVIYADECYVRIYEGATGDVVYSYGRTSCTWIENPIVADVDGDFRSEFVVPLDSTCSISCPETDPHFEGLRCADDAHCPEGSTCTAGLCGCTEDSQCGALHGCRSNVCRAVRRPRRGGIEIVRDPFDRWAPSRAIWNQHGYFVTNVDEDGTVPRSSAARRNWEVSGLNNFRQNVQGNFDPLSAPDLTAGHGSFGLDCTVEDNDLTLSVEVCNRGAAGAPPDARIVFVPRGMTAPVCETTTSEALLPGRCEVVSCVWVDAPVETSFDIDVIIDPDGTALQCRRGNDATVIEGAACPPPLG
ncbi:MAG: VCBS repeat-containing protein [Deltaproteobacteria bacterium]|nr:VCBS repeat-containing protein [Deltaproteobacteria bacterium]